MRFIYSSHIIQVFSFVCVLTCSLLGVKKAWATPRSFSFSCLIRADKCWAVKRALRPSFNVMRSRTGASALFELPVRLNPAKFSF